MMLLISNFVIDANVFLEDKFYPLFQYDCNLQVSYLKEAKPADSKKD